MPGSDTVRQAIFDHATDSRRDDAMGVMAVGHGQIQHVGVEVMVAMLAIALGIGQVQIPRPAADGVAQIVQRTMGGSLPRGAAATQRAGPAEIVA